MVKSERDDKTLGLQRASLKCVPDNAVTYILKTVSEMVFEFGT